MLRRLLLPLALLGLAQGAPPPALAIARALAWVEARGEAPLSAWWEGDQLLVAASARGLDEGAATALYKIYRGDAPGEEWNPEESIVLDAPTLLRLGAQQTLLALSERPLASFLHDLPPLPLHSIAPVRFLREPRISLLMQDAAGHLFHRRFHAFTGAPLPPGARVDFEAWGRDKPPAGFRFARTGEGRPGRWMVREGVGGQVLVQEEDDPTDYRFPLAVLEDHLFRDGALSVRVRPRTGSVDQAGGLVWRYRDEGNYYVTRANALEGNVRLYYVKDGRRVGIASWDGPARAHAWHDYKVEVEGARIRILWDGERVIEVEDRTFDREGAVGLWTKADSVTEFDDFVVEPRE